MNVSRIPAGAVALALIWTAPSAAGVPRTVEPGETLWSIAAENNLTTRALAAANGLPETAQVLAGATIEIPSEAEAAAALGVVAPVGDDTATSSLPQTMTAGQVGEIAGEHGVSASLAAAIAWQESGFNNTVVSSAGARGVMQILPDTWSWVEGNLLGRQIDPGLPQENVHVGVLYLGQLIQDAGGDEARAVAGYYQGPASVSEIGVLPETQRYVDNVMALRSRFGG